MPADVEEVETIDRGKGGSREIEEVFPLCANLLIVTLQVTCYGL